MSARKLVVLQWFGRANLIARMGPYRTQLEAWEAMRGLDGCPVAGAVVWCERHEPKRPAALVPRKGRKKP